MWFPFLLLLALPGFSVWRMARSARTGGWRRPGWFGHAAAASLGLAVLAWLWGLLSGGLDAEETCTLRRNQVWDAAYRAAHHDDWFRIFPLSNKCNASYDLVPAWVNPAVAVFTALFVIGVAGVVWTAAGRRRSTTKGSGS